MMQNSITQLHNLSPETLGALLGQELDKRFNELKKNLQPIQPTEYLTRSEVAKMLSVDLSTIHNYTKRNLLTSYGIGARVYYKRTEIEHALIKLNK